MIERRCRIGSFSKCCLLSRYCLYSLRSQQRGACSGSALEWANQHTGRDRRGGQGSLSIIMKILANGRFLRLAETFPSVVYLTMTLYNS